MRLPSPSHRLTVYQDARNEWRWRLQAGNNEIIAEGGEGYVTARGARDAAERVFPDPNPEVRFVDLEDEPRAPWAIIAGVGIAAGVLTYSLLELFLG